MRYYLAFHLPLVVSILACSFPTALSITPAVTPPASRTPTQAQMTATIQEADVIAVKALNVRQAAGEREPVLFTLNNGERVRVIPPCDSAGWIQIEFDGRTGFVNADYLSGGVCDE